MKWGRAVTVQLRSEFVRCGFFGRAQEVLSQRRTVAGMRQHIRVADFFAGGGKLRRERGDERVPPVDESRKPFDTRNAAVQPSDVRQLVNENRFQAASRLFLQQFTGDNDARAE